MRRSKLALPDGLPPGVAADLIDYMIETGTLYTTVDDDHVDIVDDEPVEAESFAGVPAAVQPRGPGP